MKSINRVVFLVLVASEAVKAYEKVEHITIVPGCLDEEKFEAKYGKNLFYKLDLQKSVIQMIREDTKSTFKTINFNSESLEIVLVKVVSQYEHYDYEKIASEIELLKSLSGLGIIPDYQDCAYRIDFIRNSFSVRYYIIQEKVDKDVSFFFTKRVSEKFKMPEMIYKFLQMALLIQKLHTLGYTHQDINPSNFVSTDARMSDFRLIDLSAATRDGSPGIEGTKYYSSPDKRGQTEFTAAFHQDAFAFALTLINLIDKEGTFDKTIKNECISFLGIFTDECKKSMIAGVEALESKVELKDLFQNLKEHFFNTDEPLDINEMMGVLIDCFQAINNSIPDDSPQKNMKLINLVNNLTIQYNENINFLIEMENSKSKEENTLEGTSPNMII